MAGRHAVHGPDARWRLRQGPVGRRGVVVAAPILLLPALPVAVALLPGTPVLLIAASLAAAGAVFLLVRMMRLGHVTARRDAELTRVLGQRDALEQELRRRATQDALTGLGNRALLTERLDAVLAPTGDGSPAALLLLDLDGFVEVNDTLGHPTGDHVLIEAARRLQSTVPVGALLARTGGDEFAILLPRAAGVATEVAAAIVEVLRGPYHVQGRDMYLSASLGVLDLDGLATSAEALRDADLALYAAKDAGRDRFVAFHAGLRSARARRSDLAGGLRRALADGKITVHYQPVVDLTDGRMAAVEALARWAGPDGRQVPPAQFIPVAEETGLIGPLGRWVLRRACTDAARWYERYGIAVTVNVSGRQLRDPDFVDTVLAALADSRLPGRALVLELTESTLVAHRDAAGSLEHLREHGVRVALDDFGTGYSSLSYLVQLPVDILKIDRAFTAPARDAGPEDWAFTRAILDLASSLHLVAIAEGVETPAQARALQVLDCPLAQGFLYSPPVPAAAIEPMLAAWNPLLQPESTGAEPAPAPVG